jgi:hypothetical protein
MKANDCFWMVEKAESTQPLYLAVDGRKEHNAINCGKFVWTYAVVDALHFERRVDAILFYQAIIKTVDDLPHCKTLDGLRDGDPIPKITEHVWL